MTDSSFLFCRQLWGGGGPARGMPVLSMLKMCACHTIPEPVLAYQNSLQWLLDQRHLLLIRITWQELVSKHSSSVLYIREWQWNKYTIINGIHHKLWARFYFVTYTRPESILVWQELCYHLDGTPPAIVVHIDVHFQLNGPNLRDLYVWWQVRNLNFYCGSHLFGTY